jgi:hypothetical protein
MITKTLKKAGFAPALAVLAGSLFTIPSARAEDIKGPTTIITVTPEYSPAELEASKLLKQIRTGAFQLATDSDTLESLSRMRVARESYARSLELVKAHINKTGEQIARLQAIKSEVAPWQQAAIDRITPIAAQIAANTEAAINHINESPNYLYSPEYQSTLSAIANDAKEMRNSVNDFLTLAAAQQKVDHLQMKILAANS